MSGNHGDNDSNGGHTPHPGTQPDTELSYHAKRLLAMKELLVEKGIISEDEVQAAIHSLRSRSPSNGAKAVARAWVDPEFKERLLADPEAAIGELGYTLDHQAKLVVVENTDQAHNVIVCTLCSCYPTSLLGPPPDWYKSLGYRSRAVIDPRGIMREFGLELAEDVEVRVHDSTADVRYLVLPQRPRGTENISEDELADMVTRDSMIGVSSPRSPESVASL